MPIRRGGPRATGSRSRPWKPVDARPSRERARQRGTRTVGPTRPDDTRRALAIWAMAALFLFSCSTALGLALRAADHVVLRCVYGAEAVRRDRLQIVSRKPVPQVSNGD